MRQCKEVDGYTLRCQITKQETFPGRRSSGHMAIREGTPEERSGATAAHGDKCGFADYETTIINPLYFKPLYPNNYRLATAPRARSMRVTCTSSRKHALQRSTQSPRLQKRKPAAALPAFPKLAGWLATQSCASSPGTAALTHILSLNHGKSVFRMSQQEAEITKGRNGQPHLSLFLLLPDS